MRAEEEGGVEKEADKTRAGQCCARASLQRPVLCRSAGARGL